MTNLKSCKALFDALKASTLKGLLIPGSVKGLRMMAETYGSKTVVYLSPESVEVSRKWAQELQEKGFKVLKDSYVTAAEGGRWNPNTGRYDGPTKLVPRLEVQVSYFRGHGWTNKVVDRGELVDNLQDRRREMTTQAAPTTYYIHEVYREDLSDPESPVTWYEYRVGKSTTQPEYYESIAGGDGEAGLATAFRYIKLVGGVAVVLWDGESSKD